MIDKKLLKRIGKMTEKQLQKHTPPWPESKEELMAYINALHNRQHTYGTAVYAMAYSALAAYYYSSHVVGATGFQASCADLTFIQKTRSLDVGFMLLDLSKALYPQYDLKQEVDDWVDKNKATLRKRAKKYLRLKDSAHPEVIAHWKKLAKAI